MPPIQDPHRERFDLDPGDRRAFEELEEAAFVAGDWSELVALYERRLEAPDLENDATERGRLLHRLGRVHAERCNAPGAALACWRDAVRADPTCRPALAEMRSEALRREQWDVALQILEAEIELEQNPGQRSRLLASAGEIWLDHTDDDAQALSHFERALNALPHEASILEGAARAAARSNRPTQAAAYWEQIAAVCDGASRARARVAQAELVDPERAAALYRRAFTDDPHNSEALRALATLAEGEARWTLAVEFHERRYEVATDTATRTEAARSVERIYSTKLDNPGAARSWLERSTAADCATRNDDAETASRKAGKRHAAPERPSSAHPQNTGDDSALLTTYRSEASVTDDPARLGWLVREIVRIHAGRGETRDALAWAERWLNAAPEETEAFLLTARLHEALAHDTELICVLERLDPLLPRDAQADNRRRLGDLHAAHGRLDPALAAYRSVLDADPFDLRAHEAAIALLIDTGASEELADTYRSLAGFCEQPRRTEVLDALARLLEEQLGDLPGAADVLAHLLEDTAPPADADERLESLLARTGRHEELAKQLEYRAKRAGAAEQGALRRRRAEVLLDSLGDSDAAVEAYRELLGDAPDDEDARAGLERSLRAAGDLPSLTDFLEEQALRHPEPAVRDRLRSERAAILSDDLDRSNDAAEIFRRLAREASAPEERRRAVEHLEVLLERIGDLDGLRSHWEAQLEDADTSQRAALNEKLGELCLHRLGDAEAAARYLEAAARLAPKRTELWRSLARLYEAAGRSADVARVLEAELETGVSPEVERALSSRIAALCTGALDDPERARRHYERLIELDPDNGAAQEFLIARWQEDGRPEEVLRLLERRLDALDAQPRDDAGHWAAQRTSLRLRIAGLRTGALDDPDGAIAVLEVGLSEIGPLAAVADPLADLYRRGGYIEDLIDLCKNAEIACEPGNERATWLKRRGDALRERGDDRDAADAYRRALDERPADVAAEAALRDLYRRLGDSEGLAGLLTAKLARLNGPEEIPARLELAALHQGSLNLPHEALAQLRRIVRVDPGHTEALARGLDLAEQLNRDEIIRELLDKALSRPQPPTLRAELLARSGRQLAATPDGATSATANLRKSLELDSSRDEVRETLRRLLESQNDWPAALDCRLAEAYRAEGARRVAHLEQGANIAWHKLSPEAALPWLERLRHEAPECADVPARIAAAHADAGQPRARLHAIEAQIELTGDPRSRRDLWCESAHLLEHELEYPARAAQALERARALCPDDPEILHTLERLYREGGRDRERCNVLEALTEQSSGAERVPILREAAAIYADRLGEPGRAAALLLQAVAETPRRNTLHAELLRILGNALRQAGPPDAWARCAEAELAALAAGGEVFAERRLALHADLDAWYRRIGRPDAALTHLRALVDDAPAGFDPSHRNETALLEALRATRNSVELECRFTAQLERTGGDAASWLELARLRDEALSATTTAAEAYRVARALDPRDVAVLRGLRSCAERLELWEEVADTLAAELEVIGPDAPRQRAALLRGMGDVHWRHLDSTTQARRAYAAAIEAWPEDLTAYRSLERLLESMENWCGAADLYEREIEVLGNREPDRRWAAWLRTGDIARNHTQDTERSLRAYVAAADIAPLPAERSLERAELHHHCGEIEAFADVFADWCDTPESGALAADHMRLAETLEALGRADAARVRIERALELETENAQAWYVSARLCEAAGEPDAASNAWRCAAALTSGAEAAEAWHHAAASSPVAAVLPLLRAAAEADPASRSVQSDLARAALDTEAWAEAETAASHALEDGDATHLEPDVRRAVALVGARAARARDRNARAIDFCEEALAADPECVEALESAGETCFALGEFQRARGFLERRLAHPDPDPSAARHLILLARCLTEAGEAGAALERCEAALERDAALGDAHSLCVELHEAAERIDAGVAALERWALTQTGTARSAPLLRAAEWELTAADRESDAERHLRAATHADPELTRAWRLLAELLLRSDRNDAAGEAALAGLRAGNTDDADRRALELANARALERAGDADAAAEAFGRVAETDPACFEATDSRARLLRAAGDWRGAADSLESFTLRYAGADRTPLAQALEQLARLLAGPLENVDGAIDAYRRAVEFEPERTALRASLGELLSQRPETWSQALAQLTATLELDPLHPGALRATLRIACARDDAAAIDVGRVLLAALGIANSSQAPDAHPRLGFPLAPEARLDGDLSETLRAAVQRVSAEIGDALRAPAELPEPDADACPAARFRAAALAAQAELTAPGLLPLPTREVGDVVRCVLTLALSPDSIQTSGAMLNALAGAIGRRARRHLKRALAGVNLASIENFDFAAWRQELRALAAARAVDHLGCDLRTALVALVCEADDRSPSEIDPTADISALVAACPEAQALVTRVVREWIARLRAQGCAARRSRV